MATLKRAQASTIQQRLGAVQDRLRIKLLDNTQRLIADATDAIRIRERKSYEGDTLSVICEKADVINCVFPPLTEVPFRKIRREGRAGGYRLTGLVNEFEDGEQQKHYTVQIPIDDDVDVGDYIFRIMDVGRDDYNVLIALQVSELLGTFGHSHLILQKVGMVIPTDEIAPEIIDVMVKIAQRRSLLGW
jgi:hypothetical protein